MTVSLIIATYNSPKALRLCLESVMRQSVMPTEILIADDGSGRETRDVVEYFMSVSPVPMHHIWHEDDGFRLAAIRNKAIAAASGEYIVQIDGDVILHRSFILDHMVVAKRGYYVGGSRALVGEELTGRLYNGETIPLSPFVKGVSCGNNAVRLPFISGFFKDYHPAKLRGCNMAFWRDDAVCVNGYDESITGWGCEDNELGCRFRNIGLTKRAIKFRAILFHLHHKLASRERIEENNQILTQSLREGKTRCEKGLDQYL